MDKRQQQLSNNRLEQLNKEVTLVLQSLQWDREQLLKGVDYVSCCYDSNHKMPLSALEEHEKRCFLKTNGYSKDEMLLPDPINSISTVKLSNEDIQMIMNTASNSKPHSSTAGVGHPIRGDSSGGGGGGGGGSRDSTSRAQQLAIARDTRRRRARYRGAPSANYSDTLREVIQSQMEVYTEGQEDRVKYDTNQSKDRTKDHEYHRRKTGNERKIEKRVSRKSPR